MLVDGRGKMFSGKVRQQKYFESNSHLETKDSRSLAFLLTVCFAVDVGCCLQSSEGCVLVLLSQLATLSVPLVEPCFNIRVVSTMKDSLCSLCLALMMFPSDLLAFTPVQRRPVRSAPSLGAKKRVLVAEETSFHGMSMGEKVSPSFDPFNLASEHCPASASTKRAALSAASSLAPLTILASSAEAASDSVISSGDLNPANFNPVCPASDGVYRALQSGTQAIVGDEAFVEYGPLIAGGLLRIRLELCVVESFFNEAVGPFIEKNGYDWILPIHESVESFLAGSVFSLATTFILVGSTKIVSVLITYVDLFVGLPSRVFGGFLFDRARGKPVTLDIGFGPFKTRVVGPPDGEQDFVQTSNPLTFLIVVGSGVVKLFGEILRVSQATVRSATADLLFFFLTHITTALTDHQGVCRGNRLVCWPIPGPLCYFLHCN